VQVRATCKTIALYALLSCLPATEAEAQTERRSGYAIGTDLCGEGAHAYPRLAIGMRQGYCAGLVASEADGLEFPRSIVQIPGRDEFVVVDMGAWRPKGGRLLLLDPKLPPTQRVKVLISSLDYPFGLAVGIDGKIYASTAETVFRFDPLAGNPAETIETILRGLPGRTVTLSDGTKTDSNSHPLKQFVFDRTGRIFVNIGSPTDNCGKPGAPSSKICPAGEGQDPLASIWVYTPPSRGMFPALKPGDPNPDREVFARGLRNSMALAVHPQYPDEGYAFLQAENARDLTDPAKPNEEINALERGKHYGWPYCYDLTTPSPEYKAFLQTNPKYKDLCNNKTTYRAPYTLLPPHSAPLGMLYYQGRRFPELAGKLIVSMHGYRPTGSRVVTYDVDARGFPVLARPPVRYGVSCAPGPTSAYQTEREGAVAAAPGLELIAEWHRVNGVRPQGAPVGMTVAADGTIWLVEDKNRTVIRIDRTNEPHESLPCNARSQKQIDELVALVEGDKDNKARLQTIRTQLVEKHCMGCHSDFGIKDRTGPERDGAALRFMLSQDGWIYPGDPESGRLRTRLRGLGAEKVMPADGRELIKNDPAYRRLLDTVDQFVSTIVPGQRMRVRGGRVSRVFYNRHDKTCGEIPTGKIVLVINPNPRTKPGSSRILKPADIYLNGECSDDDGYYLEQKSLVPL
jgi:glucose/arabinose dehydrogenase